MNSYWLTVFFKGHVGPAAQNIRTLHCTFNVIFIQIETKKKCLKYFTLASITIAYIQFITEDKLKQQIAIMLRSASSHFRTISN